MKFTVLITISILSTKLVFGQIPETVFFAKEYSKEISLFKSKEFLFTHVLGSIETESVDFEIYPLAAASSGELTTLFYKS